MPEENLNKLERNKTVRKYASALFKESSVSAVSSILTTDSIPRKVFRVLVFLILTSAFLYQCIVFFSYLLQYPTVVNIDVTVPQSYVAPAVTMCHNQKLKLSKYCEKYPDHCTETDDKFCEDYEDYCSHSDIRVKDEYLLKHVDYEDVLQLGYKLEDILIKNSSYYPEQIWFSNESLLRLRPKSAEEIIAFSNCFSANSAIGDQKEPITFSQIGKHEELVQDFQIKSDLQFILNPMEEDAFDPDINMGIFFAVHSPYNAVNPFLTGHFLMPGKNYKITIHMVEEELLPYPYKTDCKDYHKLWLQNGKTGPRSQEMCQQKCLTDVFSECYNCFMPGIIYPSAQTEVCDPNKIIDEYCDVDKIIAECVKSCKDDCSKTNYYMDIRELYLPVPGSTSRNSSRQNNRHIQVDVDIDDREIIRYVFSPKYQNVEAFSYIGGFIGIWLGISLVQVTDFFESIFLIGRYFFKRSACKKNSESVEI